MTRASRKPEQDQLTVGVDDCRVRLQTGAPILFVDTRKSEDWAASATQVAGAWRLNPETCPPHLPCPKHNYVVVYCA